MTLAKIVLKYYKLIGSIPELYIARGLHTGHIWEASLDLLHTSSQITGRAIDDVETHFPNLQPGTMKGVLNSKSFPPGMRNRWSQREARMGRILHTAKVIQDPWKVDLGLIMHLQRIEMFQETIDILVFLRRAQKRIIYFLTTDMPLENLGTLGLGIYAYVESRLLRRAVFDGVYLTKPY